VNLNGVVVNPSVSVGASSGAAVASATVTATGGVDGVRFRRSRRFRRGSLWMCWGLVQLNLVVQLI
jgi:hypothetical protein